MEYNMRTRQEIKEIAKARLAGNRGPCIGVYILMVISLSVLGGATAGIGALVLGPVIAVAASGFFAAVYGGEKRTVGDWFNTMFDGFGRKWMGMFWMGLSVFLWSLLLVVPGIVKAFAYSMTPYILSEHPNVDARDALKLSERMTDGYKMDIFVAGLSFLGWQLLSACTFGILEIVFVGPYQSLTFGGIYRELKRNAIENGTVKEEEFEGYTA
ncbi:MAG: DUF975 family protein [Clostridia bacterium]|nr:DUF975 family protein [Clostridia bacterium]